MLKQIKGRKQTTSSSKLSNVAGTDNMDSNKFRSTDRQLTATLGESSISLKKQTRDLTTDGHVNMGHSAQLRITGDVKRGVKRPQNQISADEPIADRQNHGEIKCTNTVQSNVEPPHVPQKQISAGGKNDITDKNEELQVTTPVAVRDLALLNNPTNIIEIAPQADVPQHTVQLGHKRGKNRSVCTVNPVKPVSTTDDGECLQYIFIKS